LQLDLLPALSRAQLRGKLAKPRGKRSWSDFLRRRLGLHGVKFALLYELMPREQMHDLDLLAERIKSLPLRCVGMRPLEEAISSAGGVAFEALDQQLMLKALPGVFCAGEMLDWEAPTGGYLLTACFASGYVAGLGVVDWLARQRPESGVTIEQTL
jgi:predicted flavoprotein YhiN